MCGSRYHSGPAARRGPKEDPTILRGQSSPVDRWSVVSRRCLAVRPYGRAGAGTAPQRRGRRERGLPLLLSAHEDRRCRHSACHTGYCSASTHATSAAAPCDGGHGFLICGGVLWWRRFIPVARREHRRGARRPVGYEPWLLGHHWNGSRQRIFSLWRLCGWFSCAAGVVWVSGSGVCIAGVSGYRVNTRCSAGDRVGKAW